MTRSRRQTVQPLVTTQQVAEFCCRASAYPFLAVDTEFMGEGRFFPELCLIQLAMPDNSPGSTAAIDTLSPDLSLEPLKVLFSDTSVVKVFHAARQDLAIFFHKFGMLPAPVVDTQVTAMVCGFGSNVGYSALVKDLTGKELNKSARLHDWSRRPIPQALLSYALDDVIHLRPVYLRLSKMIEDKGRSHWLQDELDVMLDPATYRINPTEAWKKVKKLKSDGKFLAVMRELAAFREKEAIRLDKPRIRVLSDEALVQLAGAQPQTIEQLMASRMLRSSLRRSGMANGILAAVKRGLATRREDWPEFQAKRDQPKNQATFELLRVLLKIKSTELGVAEQILATADELKRLSAGDTNVRQLSGWRREVFGNDAVELCSGRLAIAAKGNSLKLIGT